MNITRPLLVAALSLGAVGLAQAQATVKNDGQWRAVLGLGASASSGNTSASNLSIAGDAVRATDLNKVSLYGTLQYARSTGVTTGEQVRLGGRYDHNLSAELFAFGGLDLERNKFSNLKLRSQLSGGLGMHLLKGPATTLDVFGGLGYTAEDYINRMVIAGANRSAYRYAAVLLGEESTHKLSDTTSFKQRLVVVPNLKNRGEYRANWDAGLAVAMTKSLNLNIGVAVAHNSEPGAGRKSTDSLLTTGISVKFE